MQKIGASTASANALGEFTEGNPGAGVAATLLKAAWLNAVQRELVHLVEGAGLTLDAADDSQILKAIQAIQVNASTWLKLSGKPTTIAGFGITDAFTKLETTSAIQQKIADLVASSPAALDTLKELADALGNDPNFATTMTNALAGKASKATTLSGYGITDAYAKSGTYSKSELDAALVPLGQASEVNRGTAKVANLAQMLADTDDSVIVTPKKLRWGFSISLAANGYIVFPSWMGGLVVQWGSGTSSGATAENLSVAMPLAWPTGSFAENATIVGTDAGTHTVLRGAMTSNTMKLTTLRNGAYASGITVRWIAIGF
ncbi:hypothetical protein SAMN05216178_3957 [Pseudomonas saponiphila]|uniref:Putative tail fiber protein gp53-like C-terminal domain-containing protein n=1 Tax=Pseudomonas saponiphila TaxID=556534 RepID=A0A1H4QXU7_9PSED|nr:hypothetical protein [Pseudomonas saponiphila]SEC24433.1 hypothetical protein SAMN05216178_3957 [Pseudomonas saponiphila]